MSYEEFEEAVMDLEAKAAKSGLSNSAMASVYEMRKMALEEEGDDE